MSLFFSFKDNETLIVGVDVSRLALGVYNIRLGTTYQNMIQVLVFFSAFQLMRIWWRAFKACAYVCLHMKASGEAHLSTRQHIKAFPLWSERPPALGLLDLSSLCVETAKRLHLRGCDGCLNL